MRIGFIGAGKVGFTLGKYLLKKKQEFQQKGQDFLIDVSGYYSRSQESTKEAAAYTDTQVFNSLEEIIESSDILALTVSDTAILSVWNELLAYDLKGKIICHCSGAMTSNIFSGYQEAEAFVYSIHPMYAISSKTESYKTIGEALFSVEGSIEYLDKIQNFIKSLGNECVIIDAEDKVKYHGAAVMASNLVTGIYRMSENLLEECGFSRIQAETALVPLFMGNAKAVSEKGAVESLTGPIERNDVETVKKHLKTITGDAKNLYIAASVGTLKVAEEKHPERDYSELKKLLAEKY